MSATTDVTPARLTMVAQFLNTRDGADGDDVLADPRTARAWFDAALRPGVPVDVDSRAHLVQLREALRLTALAHNGAAHEAEAAAALAPLCAASNLSLIVGVGATPEVTGSGSGLDGFVNDVLAAVAIAAVDGTWLRLKACADPTCGRAFYDRTRNWSQRFCTAATCANRARQKAYRGRHRE